MLEQNNDIIFKKSGVMYCLLSKNKRLNCTTLQYFLFFYKSVKLDLSHDEKYVSCVPEEQGVIGCT